MPGPKLKGKVATTVQRMALAGIPNAEIAQTVGVHRSNIGRYLDKVLPQINDTRRYMDNRADILAHDHALSTTLKIKLLEQMHDVDWTQLDIDKIANALLKVTAAQDRAHQQERLERGQSTTNIALVAVDLSKFKPVDDDNL